MELECNWRNAMETTEAKIGLFDLDQTLADYEGAMRRDLFLLKSPDEPNPMNRNFGLWDENCPSYLRARMDLIKKIPGWWASLEKLKLGWEIYNLAKKIGFENHVLTKGPRSKSRAWMEKVQWVDEHLGPDFPIDIVAGSTNPNQKGLDKSHRYGLFLCDDYPPFVMGWLSHRPRGLAIVPANPSNEGVEKQHENIIRYDGTNMTLVEAALNAAFKRKRKQHWKELI